MGESGVSGIGESGMSGCGEMRISGCGFGLSVWGAEECWSISERTCASYGMVVVFGFRGLERDLLRVNDSEGSKSVSKSSKVWGVGISVGVGVGVDVETTVESKTDTET